MSLGFLVAVTLGREGYGRVRGVVEVFLVEICDLVCNVGAQSISDINLLSMNCQFHEVFPIYEDL